MRKIDNIYAKITTGNQKYLRGGEGFKELITIVKHNHNTILYSINNY